MGLRSEAGSVRLQIRGLLRAIDDDEAKAPVYPLACDCARGNIAACCARLRRHMRSSSSIWATPYTTMTDEEARKGPLLRS